MDYGSWFGQVDFIAFGRTIQGEMSAHTILVVIALILAVLAIVRPAWPFLAVSVILICAALLIGSK